jgi:hypothetical protein
LTDEASAATAGEMQRPEANPQLWRSEPKGSAPEKEIPMSQDTVLPHDLERLQIRAIAFSDRVDEVLAIFHGDDEDEPPARNHSPLLSDTDAASQVLAEILRREAHRPEVPDWFGPKEQLSIRVAGDGEALMEEADRLISEVEAHNGHSYSCRCDELRDVLVERIQPALDEWRDLIEAIEQLIRRERPGPGSESPTG